MPAFQPTPANEYEVPNSWQLSKGNVQPLLRSLSDRLKALEAQAVDLQDLIDAGTTQALAMVSENIAPQLAAVGTQVATLQGLVEEAQLVVEELLAGNIPATNVSLTPVGGIAASNMQAAVAEIDADINSRIATAVAALLAGPLGGDSNLSVTIAAAIAAVSAAKEKKLVFVNNPTSPYLASDHQDVWFDTSLADKDFVLPGTPVEGDQCGVVRKGEYTVVIDRNGKTIGGLAEDLTIDEDNSGCWFVYLGGTWRVQGRSAA